MANADRTRERPTLRSERCTGPRAPRCRRRAATAEAPLRERRPALSKLQGDDARKHEEDAGQAHVGQRLAEQRHAQHGGADGAYAGPHRVGRSHRQGIQGAAQQVDEGAIGRPVAFTAFMLCPGHESWHHNPAFYYEVGGGPMFDMGPYYLTALLNLLGPVRRISGTATTAIPDRVITSQPHHGERIVVETPDHVCGTLEFENGAAGTILTSFATRFPTYDGRFPITIYGTEGTLKVPDPNGFDGPVQLRRAVSPMSLPLVPPS